MFLPMDAVSVSITPTIDIVGAYATGDVLFVPTRIPDAVLNTKGFAYLRAILAFDGDNQKSNMDLLFFDRNPGSIAAINAANTVSYAQMANLIAAVNLAAASWTTIQANTNAMIQVSPVDLLLPAMQRSKDLWVAGICRGSPTYTAATNLTFKFELERH